MTEPLPRGANFRRAKFLWEIGLNVAGNPETPYGGDRDMCIVVGNGSGDRFRPALRMATGSPVLAHDVVNGGLDMAMVNPCGFLTQAARGVGMFKKKLPLRTVAVYPSWDRFVFMINPKTGIKSLKDIRDRKYPLWVSVKEDPTHSTRVFIDQALGYYGFSLADIVSWGGRLNVTGAPGDIRRMEPLRAGELEAVFDEGLVMTWFDAGLAHGMELIELEPDHFDYLASIGWRKATIETGRFAHLKHDHACIDYGGWPLYAREDYSEELVYQAAKSLAARAEQIVWEEPYAGPEMLFTPSAVAPFDTPLHAGSARFLRETQAARAAG